MVTKEARAPGGVRAWFAYCHPEEVCLRVVVSNSIVNYWIVRV